MCGIAGEVRFDGRMADAGLVARMSETQAPRGPDGEGLWQHGRVCFGHRRLRIIDLTDAGSQPMIDSHLGLAMVFNGCIYNYPDLRAELEAAGHRFFSTSDTEVILKGYRQWGEDVVQRLNGMFAFAIHEQDTGRVVLGRDRLGIKPLYYAEAPGTLRFASALPALVKAGDVDRDIDPVALHHYMSFHAVVPAPRTILKGVRKLPPATLMVVEPDGTRRERRYWDLSYGPAAGDAGLGFEDWRDRTLAALRRAVERRLVADVPVGVLLSGGVDSSLIVGLLAEAGQTGLNTFSIGFESVGQEKGDEFEYSDIVAEHFATRHHKIQIDSTRALPALKKCIAAMNEPMVSHDAIGFFLLSEEVSKEVKVVQSGQGADEVFAGYHWYPPLMDTAANDAASAYAQVFCDRDAEEMARTLDPRFLNGGTDHARAFIAEHFDKPGADRAIDKALRLDTQIMLVDDPVKRVDNMTMAWGLEARVPFLDHELVEMAAAMPAEHKVAEGGKYALKEAARQVIPAAVIDRPKGYFPVPALKYLQGDYLALVRDAVTSQAARERGLFQRDYVDTLLADPQAHITPLRGSKLWQIGLLELWLQTHLG
ncbi:asparagine synthase (glutamine-hydrolysing) [Rhodothalassium salexigens DSM 2132]|uniref:asparagine synthase (glutamine-hydrolyzing) n=1 Tax=Rhodothalassium salexigens DSM 2132 TaxID=1188247 RepID=A0A4R2PF54_RHOSA|nr:N-acetylglutaminylglutamine amidotransferase [Rhodothalassium salexigens]MBB4212274.1 asparagine synthase (glutamine-hydrolyzing) [Rhodothalassium salexigens DSM 2132]MBK1638368.1 N-acetylglutaminylglutamine amidotransferase [Rhodothalassium salexigens DSM 2132]TCP32575.1 asparagine synthase (glutamine-hydrolysing) [Rhodothalassium salexigens DSM 2132]